MIVGLDSFLWILLLVGLIAVFGFAMFGVPLVYPKLLAFAITMAPFFSRFSWEVFGFSVRPEMLVGALAWIGWVMRPRHVRGGNGHRRPTHLVLIPVWLCILLISSAASSPQPMRSWSVWVWLVLGFGIALWLAANRDLARKVVGWSIWTAWVMALLGLGLWLGSVTVGPPSWGMQLDPAYGGYASYVFVFEANIFAGLIVIWSLIGLTRHAEEVPNWVRLSLYSMAPAVALAAHTRAALIAWILGGVIMLSVGFSRRIAARGLLVSGVLGALVTGAVGLSAAGLDKFTEVIEFGSGTGAYRLDTWEVAVRDLNDGQAWALGLGLNSFPQRHIDPTRVSAAEPWYLGNIFLQVVYDGGILSGLIAFGIVFYTWRNRRTRTSVALLLSYAVLGAATSVLWLAQSWVWLGLAVSLARREDAGLNEGRFGGQWACLK